MADGKGCNCGAYDQSECACDVDWTPQEVYDLRAEVENLRHAILRLADQDATLSLLCKMDGSCIVTVQMDTPLTDEERAAVEWFSHFARPQNGPVIGRHAATLRSLL
jgi:hypothetical protein